LLSYPGSNAKSAAAARGDGGNQQLMVAIIATIAAMVAINIIGLVEMIL
jgi:hypothetical protein